MNWEIDALRLACENAKGAISIKIQCCIEEQTQESKRSFK
jgi:hypothetical protein